MGGILMMSPKLATLGLLNIKVFRSKSYDVILSIYDFANNILSSDSGYIVDLVMWPKFGNSSVSMREVVIKFYKIWAEKADLFSSAKFSLR